MGTRQIDMLLGGTGKRNMLLGNWADIHAVRGELGR